MSSELPQTFTIRPPRSALLKDAHRVWEKARDAALFFMEVFAREVAERRTDARRGALTDKEQDLLRAAVVFSGAGLDAIVKQILSDAGQALITEAFLETKEGESFLKVVNRRLRPLVPSAGMPEDGTTDSKASELLLIRLILSDNPRAAICRELTESVTRGSLQSVEELSKVCSLFGLDRGSVITPREGRLRDALNARNKMVHEMDINLCAPRRSRIQRRMEEVQDYIGVLFETAKAFLEVTDERLSSVRSPKRPK